MVIAVNTRCAGHRRDLRNHSGRLNLGRSHLLVGAGRIGSGHVAQAGAVFGLLPRGSPLSCGSRRGIGRTACCLEAVPLLRRKSSSVLGSRAMPRWAQRQAPSLQEERQRKVPELSRALAIEEEGEGHFNERHRKSHRCGETQRAPSPSMVASGKAAFRRPNQLFAGGRSCIVENLEKRGPS